MFSPRPKTPSIEDQALGFSEATVQQRREDADSELLVQMPGVDDPAHVKQILQTAAVLELYDVKGGPLPAARKLWPRTAAFFPSERG